MNDLESRRVYLVNKLIDEGLNKEEDDELHDLQMTKRLSSGVKSEQEICDCSCHRSHRLHATACCYICATCNQRIRVSYMRYHKRHCKGKI